MNTPKQLVRLLRHTALSRGCQMDDQGFILLVNIIGLSEFRSLTIAQLQKIAQEDQKGRFELRYTYHGFAVRAVQGHSFGLNMCYPTVIPRRMIHGTDDRGWEFINFDGVRVMTRDYIHAVDSHESYGLRHNATTLIYFGVEKVVEAGIAIHLSPNGYLLSRGNNGLLCPCFFAFAIRRSDGVSLPFMCHHHI
ncbi:tRNA 2'-phosphotransferase 1-like [Ruditapes philippinarum]|uniref:tRNA 2'-phosphotransferase 1-like n=1 Tax=Ruditapes philippinarum TaxID=129788 RepID=UPI00295B4C18|nr:tRNA 2'-phosphotransferase 1-like [Ruditapes philippinarum]